MTMNPSIVTDNDLMRLDMLFGGDTLEKALGIVDARLVTLKQHQGTSKRFFFGVQGSADFPYTCTRNYCSCPAFMNSVIKKRALTCKHILATRIAHALQMCQVETLNDQQFVAAFSEDKNANLRRYNRERQMQQRQQQQQAAAAAAASAAAAAASPAVTASIAKAV
jgi:predicted nucleic acid-binding Zn finger protein